MVGPKCVCKMINHKSLFVVFLETSSAPFWCLGVEGNTIASHKTWGQSELDHFPCDRKGNVFEEDFLLEGRTHFVRSGDDANSSMIKQVQEAPAETNNNNKKRIPPLRYPQLIDAKETCRAIVQDLSLNFPPKRIVWF